MAQSGFSEIQQTPKRYRPIDLAAMVALCAFTKLLDLQRAHHQWVDDALHGALTRRDDRWTQALAVGSQGFVEKIKDALRPKALHRELDRLDGTYALKEAGEAYKGRFGVENAGFKAKKHGSWESDRLTCDNLARPYPPGFADRAVVLAFNASVEIHR